MSVLLTVALVPMLRPLALRLQMVDEPGGRKVHSRPIPRVGGMAMAVGIFVPVVLWNYADRFVWAYLSGAAIIVAFGMADDSRGLSPKWKLVGQLAAALLVVYKFGEPVRSTWLTLSPCTAEMGWISTTGSHSTRSTASGRTSRRSANES